MRRGFTKSSAGPFVIELKRGKRGQLSRQRTRRDSGRAGQPYLARAGAPREVTVDGAHGHLGRVGGRPGTAIGAGATGSAPRQMDREVPRRRRVTFMSQIVLRPRACTSRLSRARDQPSSGTGHGADGWNRLPGQNRFTHTWEHLQTTRDTRWGAASIRREGDRLAGVNWPDRSSYD